MKSLRMRAVAAVFLVPVLALTAAGCSNGSSSSSPSMSPTTDLTAEMVQVTQAGAGQAPTMTFPVPSSAQVLSTKDVKVGEGTGAATAGSTVTANYVGMGATTGKVFDSSYSHGGPISFPLSRVIPGWTEGIPGMKVGGERVLVIPGAKAYGPDGQGSDILPNETLVFYVQLTKIS